MRGYPLKHIRTNLQLKSNKYTKHLTYSFTDSRIIGSHDEFDNHNTLTQ